MRLSNPMLGLPPLGAGRGLRPLGSLGGDPGTYSLSPEEEQSLIRSLATGALGAFATVGNILDTPAAFGRDLLAGKNPFPGVFDPEQRTSGRDLLEQVGVLSENEEGLDAGDIAGFLGEIALDPLTYMTFGASALGRAGQIARRAGLLDDVAKVAGRGVGKRLGRQRTSLRQLVEHGGDEALEAAQRAADSMGVRLDEVLDEGLGGLVGFGLPFQDPSSVFGIKGKVSPQHGLMDAPGPLGQVADRAVLDRVPFARSARETLARANELGVSGLTEGSAFALDEMFGRLGQTAPARFGKMLLDSPVMGRFGRYEQDLARRVHSEMPKATARAKMMQFDAIDQMDEVFEAFKQSYGDRISSPLGGATPPEGIGLGVGDVVQAADRGNFGRVMGFGDDGADVFFRNPETGATKTVRMAYENLSQTYKAGTDEATQYADLVTRDIFDRIVKMTAETGGDAQRAFDEILEGAKVSDELAEQIAKIGDDMQAANAAIHSDIEGKGGFVRWIEGSENFEQLPRYTHPKVQEKSNVLGRLAPTTHAGMRGRREEIARVPEEIVNKVLVDPLVREEEGVSRLLSRYGQYLDQQYKMTTDADYKQLAKAVQDNPGDAAAAQALEEFVASYDGRQLHAEELKKWVGQHAPRSLFTREATDNYLKYQVNAQRVSRSIDAIHELFRDTAGTQGVPTVPLREAFEQAYMKPDEALAHFATKNGMSVEEAARLAVPAEAVQAAQGVLRTAEYPEWAKKIGQAIDKFNQVFKTSVTVPFPSFASRNFISGQHVNLSTGFVNSPQDLLLYGEKFMEAWKSKDNPSKELLRELQAYRVMQKQGFDDVTMFAPERPVGLVESPRNIAETRRQTAQYMADNPLLTDDIPGGRAVRAGWHNVTRTGAKVNQNVEWMNRVPMYLYLKEKGYTAEAAARKVHELQFDYSDVSPFEQGVMKRIIPFYSFTRKAIPMTARTLIERPGGMMAQTIRASNPNDMSDGPIPEYVAETASIPLQRLEDGSMRYLTGFGLAHEDPLSFVNDNPVMELLSRSSPLVKGPLEWATGQSFFQRGPRGGRDLADLDPTIGRTLSNLMGEDEPYRIPGASVFEPLLANSPLSRAATTARMFSDPRKGLGNTALNFLTGMRTTDVPPFIRDKMLRELAEAELAANPVMREFSQPYIPEGMEGYVSDRDQQLLSMLQSLRRRKQSGN